MTKLLPGLGLPGNHGILELTGDELTGRYGHLPQTGHLELTVNGLQPGLIDTQKPLGNFSLSLDDGNDDGLRGSIANLPGDNQLYIDGEVICNSDANTIAVRARAWTGTDASEQVRQLLPLLGPVKNGRAEFSRQYQL